MGNRVKEYCGYYYWLRDENKIKIPNPEAIILPVDVVKSMIEPYINGNTLILRESTLEDYINEVLYEGTRYTIPITTIFALFPQVNKITYKEEDSWEMGQDIWETYYRKQFDISNVVNEEIILKKAGYPIIK